MSRIWTNSVSKSTWTVTALATAAAMGIAGCGDSVTEPAEPAAPQEAQLRTRASVTAMSETMERALDRWSEEDVLNQLLASVDSLSEAFADEGEDGVSADDPLAAASRALSTAARFEAPLARWTPSWPAAMAGDGMMGKKGPRLTGEDGASGGSAGDDYDEDIDIGALFDEILQEQNYQGDGVYRVPTALLCDDEGVVDPDCQAEVETLALALHVTLAADGVDIALQVGDAASQPLFLELRPQRISLVVDLGEYREALVALSDSVLNDEDLSELPEVMEGQVALSLLAHSSAGAGQDDVEIAYAVREAVRLESESEGVSVSVEARDPMMSVRLGADELSLLLDMGRTQLTMPAAELADEGDADAATSLSGEAVIDWRGASFHTVLEAGSDRLQIRDIGLGDGPSTITVAGSEILRMVLNPEADHRFDLDIAPAESAAIGADAMPVITVSPMFDFEMAVDDSSIVDATAGDSADAPEATVDRVRISLRDDGPDGSSRPQIQAVDPSVDFPGGIAVLAGELRLEADSAAADIVVTAGQCLIDIGATDAGGEPIDQPVDDNNALSELAVAECLL